ESRRCSKDSSIDESPLAVKKRLEENRRKHERSGSILTWGRGALAAFRQNTERASGLAAIEV
ncbi:MAG: hypothetical protein ACREF9_13910, partial [Opitutaceae bacterium]